MSVRSSTISCERRALARRGYTLTELLVVIGIFVLVLVIAVPAFRSIIYTSEQSVAENALRQGLAAARDTAARSRPGQDAAAVFLFQPGGRSSIVTAIRVAEVSEPVANDLPRTYELFVAAPGVEPVQLPRFWNVRGLARPGMITGDDQASTDAIRWYGLTYANTPPVRDRSNWVLPENAFFAAESADQGRTRASFMVRFEGGTGLAITTDEKFALFLSPSPALESRQGTPFTTLDSDGRPLLRVDQEPDSARFVRRALAARATNVISEADLRRVLGPGSTDMVRVRAVGQLALANERRLAASLGLRLDRQTDTFYQPFPQGPSAATLPTYASLWVPTWADQRTQDVNDWLEARTSGVGTFAGANADQFDGRIFTVVRYQGQPVEITGTNFGLGVTP